MLPQEPERVRRWAGRSSLAFGLLGTIWLLVPVLLGIGYQISLAEPVTCLLAVSVLYSRGGIRGLIAIMLGHVAVATVLLVLSFIFPGNGSLFPELVKGRGLWFARAALVGCAAWTGITACLLWRLWSCENNAVWTTAGFSAEAMQKFERLRRRAGWSVLAFGVSLLAAGMMAILSGVYIFHFMAVVICLLAVDVLQARGATEVLIAVMYLYLLAAVGLLFLSFASPVYPFFWIFGIESAWGPEMWCARAFLAAGGVWTGINARFLWQVWYFEKSAVRSTGQTVFEG